MSSQPVVNESSPSLSLSSIDDTNVYPIASFVDQDDYCQLPQYLNYFSILGLLGVTALTRISYLVKMFIIIGLVTAQCVMNLTILNNSFNAYDIRTYQGSFTLGHEITLSVIIFTIAIALFLINRQVRKRNHHYLI